MTTGYKSVTRLTKKILTLSITIPTTSNWQAMMRGIVFRYNIDIDIVRLRSTF